MSTRSTKDDLLWRMPGPRGEPLFRIDAPDGITTTNCAYGGPGNRRLYIVESRSGTILTADLPVAGRPMYSHADG